MTDRRENAPPPEGWQLPPRCCGTWATGLACGVCGRWTHEIPPNIELGTE